MVSETLWAGIETGFILSLPGVVGGLAKQGMVARRTRVELVDSASKKEFYKCPKCGVEYESNPEFCTNCGRRLRRTIED